MFNKQQQLGFFLIAGMLFSVPAISKEDNAIEVEAIPASAPCYYSEKSMLAMSPFKFDQDFENGWPSIADQEGCLEVAADLIQKYYQTQDLSQNALKNFVWHEGQIRAELGQYKAAIRLMEQAKKNEDEDDIGWNFYVDATIAFLQADMNTLKLSREKLQQIPIPADLPTTDGDGNPYEVVWPPNLNIVDQFIKCFGQDYAVAYAQCKK
jgi:hypothetical protein